MNSLAGARQLNERLRRSKKTAWTPQQVVGRLQARGIIPWLSGPRQINFAVALLQNVPGLHEACEQAIFDDNWSLAEGEGVCPWPKR